MAKRIEVDAAARLSEYERLASLAPAVDALRAEARRVAPRLEGRTVWMVNSTESGGGVAEMLPTMVSLMRELGVRTEWAVIEATEPAFFGTTKLLHNLLHAEGEPVLGSSDRAVYEAVNRRNAEEMRPWLRGGDVLAVHDPQPMALASMLAPEVEVSAVWRCHIGVDEETQQTRAAWSFLRPYAEPYGAAIFSAPEYVPDFFADRARVIPPAIDPLAPKNRELSVKQVTEVLARAALATYAGPLPDAPFEHAAQRLRADGSFAPASLSGDPGLLFRPTVTQISRWDRLKGFVPLMKAFELAKRRAHGGGGSDAWRRRVSLARLLLVGPDPGSVADDPEGQEVLREIVEAYRRLDAPLQDDVAVIALPMESRLENALMVNAIQRTSSVVAQNSLREGFGLTVTEAMWKGAALLSNRRAVGPRHQIRDGVDGVLVEDPEDLGALSSALERMLGSPEESDRMGRSAQRRVGERYLVLQQVAEWLRLLSDLVPARA